MSGKVFFDTNILVYANDSSDPRKQSAARGIIKEKLASQSAVISVQVLSEFWVTVTQKIKKPLARVDAERQIELFELMEIVDLTLPVFQNALKLQKLHSFSFWDSLIISAAHSTGCGFIYSEDIQGGRKIFDMMIENPLTPV